MHQNSKTQKYLLRSRDSKDLDKSWPWVVTLCQGMLWSHQYSATTTASDIHNSLTSEVAVTVSGKCNRKINYESIFLIYTVMSWQPLGPDVLVLGHAHVPLVVAGISSSLS